MGKGLALYFFCCLFFLLFLPAMVLSWDFVGIREEPLLKVYHHQISGVIEMGLEEYLRGVVAGEMPVSFPMEALKAQAVVSRTYALSRFHQELEGGGAHITTDSSRHQAWFSTQELLKRWGAENFFSYYQRIAEAVEATRGEVLTYDGDLIEALYHSNAGGRTEDPKYLWNSSIPYLQSVKSPWDEMASRFLQVSSYSFEELEERLGVSPPLPLNILHHSPSGRVIEIQVGEEIMEGRHFRARLALPSTIFFIQEEGEGILIETKGHGHGVGMSQYGAQGMAEEGYTYQEILGYYYQDVSLVQMQY